MRIKIIFIVGIIIIAIIWVRNRTTNNSLAATGNIHSNPKNPSVLGVKKDSAPDQVDTIIKEVEKSSAQLIDITTQAVGKAAQGVTTSVVDSVVANLAKQIDKLPKPQQDELKKAVCR